MGEKAYDVVAIGNAIVDILAHAEESQIEELKLSKNAMQLVDLNQAGEIYNAMSQTIMQSGGSASNTIAGLASLGAKCAFQGKISDDEFGKAFIHDMSAIGVDFTYGILDHDDLVTARCHILVTPDGERTMCTYLGASTEFEPGDLDLSIISDSKILYLEGYLFDKPKAKHAFQSAAKTAEENGINVALSLSDLFCVERHRDDFLELVDNHISLLFCNESEVKALYQIDDIDAALEKLAQHCPYAAVTLGAKGAVILKDGKQYRVSATAVEKVVDTTGAGDLFAAGFLYGYVNGYDPEECGRLGAAAAGEIITHMGARPDVDLKTVIAA